MRMDPSNQKEYNVHRMQHTIQREIFARCNFRRQISRHENKKRENLNGTHHTCAVAIVCAKIETTKISSKGSTSNSAKFCTSENFPLYANQDRRCSYPIWPFSQILSSQYRIACQFHSGGKLCTKYLPYRKQGRHTCTCKNVSLHGYRPMNRNSKI